jgi:hypothetical protein
MKDIHLLGRIMLFEGRETLHNEQRYTSFHNRQAVAEETLREYFRHNV